MGPDITPCIRYIVHNLSCPLLVDWLQVILDNGIVQLTLTKPGGIVTIVKYGGIQNLLESHNKEGNRG